MTHQTVSLGKYETVYSHLNNVNDTFYLGDD